ncbi:MAG: nucleoside triphosphate pyrophosphohydrolase family protein [Pirellulaceae bacterium]|nr:nucleoside triphosphate pyrophosphohydrolase family protein [Pirellulaceae bacterium]
MNLQYFQREAAKTDQVKGDDDKSKLVPLLGLAGEVGTLLSEYKKFLRDGGAHQRFHEQVAEDLGDLLWYIANVATKFNLDLDDIAKANLRKVNDRWTLHSNPSQQTLFDPHSRHLLDEDATPTQQLPRKFTVEINEVWEGESVRVIVSRDGKQIGNDLTDNAYDDDGYRFHDVFHLSYAAVLGWSPVTRKLLDVKRKDNGKTDEVEDGARAGIIEELIAQLVYTYAREHNFLEGVNSLDYHLLKTIQSLVADREVRVRSAAEWETAILQGYRVWRSIRENGGGFVDVDLLAGSVSFRRVNQVSS